MKEGFGKTIRALMDQADIKSAVVLADRINEEAKKAGLEKKLVSPSSVSKWLSDETQPKATSLMFLAKALRVSADLILFENGENPNKLKELTKMVTAIVQAETKKILGEGRVEVENELALVLKSKNVPQGQKDALIRIAQDLLKLYEKIE